MPVYNAEKYLHSAIDSILLQSYSNIEFIIFDDGSTDNSLAIMQSYLKKDNRIHIFSRKNRGIVDTLNEALEHAHGHYIARMDADDIALPKRLERQLKFLDANPDYGVVGSWVKLFGDKEEVWHHRQFDNFIRNMLFFKTPGFSHSAVMLRREVYTAFKYNTDHQHLEDADLFRRIATQSRWKLYNIPSVLLHYRINNSQISLMHQKKQENEYKKVIKNYLDSFGVKTDETILELHMKICNNNIQNKDELLQALKWLEYLYETKNELLSDDFHLFREKALILYENFVSSVPICIYKKLTFINDDIVFLREKYRYKGVL